LCKTPYKGRRPPCHHATVRHDCSGGQAILCAHVSSCMYVCTVRVVRHKDNRKGTVNAAMQHTHLSRESTTHLAKAYAGWSVNTIALVVQHGYACDVLRSANCPRSPDARQNCRMQEARSAPLPPGRCLGSLERINQCRLARPYGWISYVSSFLPFLTPFYPFLPYTTFLHGGDRMHGMQPGTQHLDVPSAMPCRPCRHVLVNMSCVLCIRIPAPVGGDIWRHLRRSSEMSWKGGGV
jgi:hypothetical protein